MPLGLCVFRELMRAWQSDPVLGHITTFGVIRLLCSRVCCFTGFVERRMDRSGRGKSNLSKAGIIISITGKGNQDAGYCLPWNAEIEEKQKKW